MNTRSAVTLVLWGVLLSACGPDPTVANHPILSSVPPAATPTVFPIPSQLPSPTIPPAFLADHESESVSVVCLTVSANDETQSRAMEIAVRTVLIETGMTVAASDSTCGATLSIGASFRAIGANYASPTESCLDYNGAEMDGQVRLETSDGRSIAIPLHRRKDPYQQINSCAHPTPDLAPFGETWPGSVLDALVQIWGPPLLVYALDEEHLSDAAINRIRNLDQNQTAEWGPDFVSALIRTLGSGGGQARARAAEALSKFAPLAHSAIPHLGLLLSHGDPTVRAKAAETLGSFGEPSAPAVPFLIRLLEDEDPSAQNAAIRALGLIGPGSAEAVPQLIALLAGSDFLPVDKIAIVEALGGIGPTAAASVPILTQYLHGDNMPASFDAEKILSLRIAAAIALVRIQPDILPILDSISELADSEDNAIQEQAVWILSGLAKAHPEAIPHLIHILDRSNNHIGAAVILAIDALGNCGPAAREAVPSLENLLEDPSQEYIHPIVLVALVRIGELDPILAADRIIEWIQNAQSPHQQVEPVKALGELGPQVAASAVPVLIELLNSEDSLVRVWAIDSLGEMGDQAAAAIPRLIEFVPDPTMEGSEAVFALGEIGPAAISAVPAILAKLKTETNAYTRETEIDALQKITGYDFGDNELQWSAWWEEYQSSNG